MSEHRLSMKSLTPMPLPEDLKAIPEVNVYTEAHEPFEEFITKLGDAIVPAVLQSHTLTIYAFTAPRAEPLGTLRVSVAESTWKDRTPCYEVHCVLASEILPPFETHALVSPRLVTWFERHEAAAAVQEVQHHAEHGYLLHTLADGWVRCPRTLLFHGASWVLATLLLDDVARAPRREILMYTTYAAGTTQLVAATAVPASFDVFQATPVPCIGVHFDPPMRLCHQVYLQPQNREITLFRLFDKYIARQALRRLSAGSTYGPVKEAAKEIGLEWESIFYDEKDSELLQIQEYLKTHPELTHMLTEWTKSVLTIKPKNIYEHARHYFDLT